MFVDRTLSIITDFYEITEPISIFINFDRIEIILNLAQSEIHNSKLFGKKNSNLIVNS